MTILCQADTGWENWYNLLESNMETCTKCLENGQALCLGSSTYPKKTLKGGLMIERALGKAGHPHPVSEFLGKPS